MNFEIALRLLKAGHSVRSKNWKNGFYIALADGKIKLFQHGNVCSHIIYYNWDIIAKNILSDDWEVIEPMTFYDQGYRDGHEDGWDFALKSYLKSLESNSFDAFENSRSIITNLQENKHVQT